METVDQETLSCARQIEDELLNGIETVGTLAIATALGIDPSYVSKLKTPDQKINLASIALMIAVIGKKIVAKDARTIDEERHHALVTLADLGMKFIKSDTAP